MLVVQGSPHAMLATPMRIVRSNYGSFPWQRRCIQYMAASLVDVTRILKQQLRQAEKGY